MKFNFKKISAIATSVLMTGMTVGSAMAAGISPTDLGGQGNFAIVYSATTASSMDYAQAAEINTALKAQFTSSPVTLDGEGDRFKIEKRNTKFNLINDANEVYTSLDSEEMPDFLKDFKYKDSNKKEFDVEQTINLEDHKIEMISERGYKDSEPTLGIIIPKGEDVLSYTMSFSPAPSLTDGSMKDSEMNLFGKTYYVYETSKTAITLLDASSSQTIEEGEDAKQIEIGGTTYSVSIDVYAADANSGNRVLFTVNGETLSALESGESEKLDDGSYLVVKDVLYAPKESGVSKVDFSIGKGEIKIKDSRIELNEKKVEGVSATIGSSSEGGLNSLTLKWITTDKTYLTGAEGYQKISFPLFGGIDYVFTGMEDLSEYDEFKIVPGEDYLSLETEIQYGDLDLPVLYLEGEEIQSTLGEASDRLLITGAAKVCDTGYDWDKVKNNCSVTADPSNTTLPLSNAEVFDFNLTSEENYFVVSYINGDEGYTYAYEVYDIDEEEDEVTLTGLTGESEIILKVGKDIDRGDFTFSLVDSNIDGEEASIIVTASGSGKLFSDRIVAKSGLVATLPTRTGTAKASMKIGEQDKDGNLEDKIPSVVVDIESNSDGIMAKRLSAGALDAKETADDDVYIAYVKSELATPIEMDRSGDLETFVVKYTGEETYGNLYVAQSGVAQSSKGDNGLMIFRDTEASSYAGKNLVIVGGSCVNSAAASALGVPSDRGTPGCYADTGLAAGQFLITKKAIDGGKFAVVVAGYEADDTVKAAQLFIEEGIAEGKYSTITSEKIQ